MSEGTPPLGITSLPPAVEPGAHDQPGIEEGTLLVEAPVRAVQIWLTLDASSDRIPVDRFPFSVGRDDACDLVVNDKTVSRRHFQIERAAGVYFLQDLGSRNGVIINGQAVERTLLVSGDELRVGNVRLGFRIESDSDHEVELPTKRPRKGVAVAVGAGLLIGAAALVAVAVEFGVGRGAVVQISEDGGIQGAALENSADTLIVRNSISEVGQGREVSSVVSASNTDPESQGVLPAQRERGSAPSVAPEGSSQRGKPKTRAPDSAPLSKSTKDAGEMPKPGRTTAVSERPSDGRVSQTMPVRRTSPAGKTLAKPAPENESIDAFETVRRNAKQAYLDMQPDKAVELLRGAKSRAPQPADKASLEQLQSKIEALVQLNQRAGEEFGNGRRDQAFMLWGKFMDTERQLFPDRRSGYASAVTGRVIAEYNRLGQQAQAEQRYQDAYRMWERAVALDPSGQAASSLLALKGRARDLFREGYRLESADLSQAKEHWQEVLELVPPGSEYHVKARAKLAWYERYAR